MKSIPYNIGVATIGRIVANALGVVIVGFLTRALGPEKFGDYNTIFAYLFLFNVLADMGLYTLLVREISRDGADEPNIVSNIFTLRLLLVMASMVLASLVSFLLPYSSVVRFGIFIATFSTIFSSLVQVLMGVFQKHLALHLPAIADIATRAVQLLGVYLLLSFGKDGILAFVGVVVVAGFAQLCLILPFAYRIVHFRIHVDVAFWKQLLKQSLPIAVSLLFTLLYFKIDTVMLSLMKSSYDVGVYSVGYKVLEVVIFFPAMYVGLVMPLLSRFADSRKEFLAVFSKAFRSLSLGAVMTIVGLIVFARPIVSILGGPDFVADSAPVLVILSFAVGIIFLGNLGGNALIALNLQRKAMWIYGAGAAVNIIANLLLIPRYSYTAAAWNTVATEFLVTAGMFLLIARALRNRVSHP